MLVYRATAVVKKGRLDEAVALDKAEWERMSPPHGFRMYVPVIGPRDVFAIEVEFESLSEYERFRAEKLATAEHAVFAERICGLLETGGCTEIWRLAQ